MGFYEVSKELLNKAFTENGDIAYKSTGSAYLDYFSLIGGMRYNLNDASKLFMKSYFEDPLLTIKILFYIRDIKAGLGERNIFRIAINTLSNMYPEVAKQIIQFIPKYGRFDDVLACLGTPIEDNVIEMISKQLEEDIKNKEEEKPISLLAKWLPSINTSSQETRYLAKKVAKGLGYTYEEYRKILSSLRKNLIVENNLREKDYTFNYNVVPGGAMMKYRKAFIRNDQEKYSQYLNLLKSGNAKINTKNLYPYEIIRALDNRISNCERETLDLMWKNFDRSEISSKTIVVRDGSGSMYDNYPVRAIDVSTSIAILFAEQLTGEFKNKFITFSSHPEIVEIKGGTILEKYRFISYYDDWTNTNIKAVYDLILDVYKHPNFKKEDALERIVIISDMQFDCLPNTSSSTFEYFKTQFNEIGFVMPEVVFWNVRARDIQFPTLNENNVKLVGGASARIIEDIIKNTNTTPYEFMIECLEKYSFIDSIKL